jgi:hypothetical protein
MSQFSSSFLLFFHQVALGGLLALSATPFHELDRAFYKSTGGVLLVVALFGLWGKTGFYLTSLNNRFDLITAAEAIFHYSFAICFAVYIISLWSENQWLRARSFSASIITGLVALILAARNFYAAPALSFESLFYPASFLLSALLLGTVTVGMLIGHWYLIDTGQSLAPFSRVYYFFVVALIIQTAFFCVSAPLLYFLGSAQSWAGLQRLWLDHSVLFVMRVSAGQIAPLVLAWMIRRTLLIPHTMAATGLFYIALLGVFVGEILGRQILALTALPF